MNYESFLSIDTTFIASFSFHYLRVIPTVSSASLIC